MKTIVAICGVAGSGKDTACNYLVEKHWFRKMSFATPMKEMVKIAFGFTDEQLYGPSSKREEQDVRYPFSGICLSCGEQCRAAFIAKHGVSPYRCDKCDRNYPPFVTARLALQALGTEWGRRLSVDLWAKAPLNSIMASDHDRWCISDLRYRNEFDAVKSAGGSVIRLMRGHVEHNHPTETELLTIPLSQFDMVVHNNAELDILYHSLDMMMQSTGDESK